MIKFCLHFLCNFNFQFRKKFTKLLHFRFALRRNLNLMTFDNMFPFPDRSFIGHMLDNHPSLHKLSHFDIAAEHMMYNRDEFNKVMPIDTVYVSSLRETYSQLKSAVKYFWPVSHQNRKKNPKKWAFLVVHDCSY